jgi:hypothetical protein
LVKKFLRISSEQQCIRLNWIIQVCIWIIFKHHKNVLDANKSVVQFLTEVLSIGRRSLNFGTVNEIVKKHVVNYGGELLYQCLNACIFTLSANLRYDVSNLIKSLIQLDSQVI